MITCGACGGIRRCWLKSTLLAEIILVKNIPLAGQNEQDEFFCLGV